MQGTIIVAMIMIAYVHTMLLSRIVRRLERRVKDLEESKDATAQKEQP